MSFFRELRRRNVHKVATVYLLCAWLTVEIVWIFLPTIESPDDFLTVVLVIAALGFVSALWIAWKFEMTPSGMKRTENVAPNESIPYWSRKKFGALVVSVGGLALLLLVYRLWRIFAH